MSEALDKEPSIKTESDRHPSYFSLEVVNKNFMLFKENSSSGAEQAEPIKKTKNQWKRSRTKNLKLTPILSSSSTGLPNASHFEPLR